MERTWRSFIIMNQDTDRNPCIATLSTEEASSLKGNVAVESGIIHRRLPLPRYALAFPPAVAAW